MSIVPRKYLQPSVVSLLIANAVPIVGVLFFGWDVFQIIFLYWLESGVVGFYSVLKIIMLPKLPTPMRTFMVLFFMVHFGGFMAVHLLFILFLFNLDLLSALGSHPLAALTPLLTGVALPFATILVSHGVSFQTNFVEKKEFSQAEASELMDAPYKRVIIMQLTIILGSFFILELGQPIWGLVLLIVVKIRADLYSHLKEHEKKT